MADEDLELEGAGEEGAGEGGKKKGGMKLIIIVAVGLIVLFGAGFGAWWFLLAGDEAPPPPAAPAAQQGQAPAEGAAPAQGQEGAAQEKPGTIVQLEPFVVNLADPGGKRYLKLTMAVDAGDEKLKAEIDARLPQIRDSILLLLTSKAYQDIAEVAGKIRLRTEVLAIFNRYLAGAGSVHAVYFSEFVIQ